MTLGKGIGGGFPLSAMLTTEAYDLFQPGDQGGTYTGQPLAMAAGLAVVQEILDRDLAANADLQGRHLKQSLNELANTFPITEVRGKGLLIAFDLPEGMAPSLAALCMEKGLLINASNASTIRLMPPLIVEQTHIHQLIGILKEAMEQLFMNVG